MRAQASHRLLTVIPIAAGLALLMPCDAPAAGGCNPYMVGMHDYNDTVRDLMTHNGERRGWVLVLQSLEGYSGGLNGEAVAAANAGFGVLVRLHWGYGTTGTLPWSSRYDAFAANAANFIRNHLPYCKVYHIGNEPSLCAEWPGGGAGDGCCNCAGGGCSDVREKITVERYADCYIRTYNACVALGLSGFRLAPAPTGTWAGDFACPANDFDTFDYVCYEQRIYQLIPHHMIGALSFHPKTYDHALWQIGSDAMFPAGAVFGCNHNQAVHHYFHVYYEMLEGIPADLRDRPIFFTELNPHDSGWANTNNGYVVAAYNDIAHWNATHTDRQITAMMLYRWDDGEDRWDIWSRPGVHDDLRAAVANGQTSNGNTICGGATPPTATPTGPGPTSTPTNTPLSGIDVTEPFNTMPAWRSTYEAPWGAAGAWSIVSGGQSGTFLQAALSQPGSSAKVLVFEVPPAAVVTVSASLRCPVFDGSYWMEFGYRLGEYTAADFDNDPGAWTLVQKFENVAGSNGNGNTWTQYESTVNTGTATRLSVGFKLGAWGNAAPTVGVDTLRVSGGALPATSTPTRTPTRTPTHTVPPVTSTPTNTPTRTATSTPTSTIPFDDADRDGVPDFVEGYPPLDGQTNRYLADSDGDGLGDGREDANRNGLRDAGETYARYQDSDGDTLEDGVEVLLLGSDPLDAGKPASWSDADGDRLPSQIDLNDGATDSDQDRFGDAYEAAHLGLEAAYLPGLFPPLGDASRDGATTNLDALMIQAVFLRILVPGDIVMDHADANRDGFVSNVDALVTQAFFLGALAQLPAGSPVSP